MKPILLKRLDNNISWLNFVKEHNGDTILAYMRDKASQLHIYDVHYRGKIASNQEIVVFIDVTQLQMGDSKDFI